MSYQVDFTTAAARQIKNVARPARDRVLQAVDALGADPRPPGSRKIVGHPAAWRIRVGDYRVIYEVSDQLLTVTVVRAGHRRGVYDDR